MRKFLDGKFWSHGTPLGSMGPLSQKALDKIFSNYQILVIWGPYGPNIPLVYETHAENLKPSSIMKCSRSESTYRNNIFQNNCFKGYAVWPRKEARYL